jgi:hypothetical protein
MLAYNYTLENYGVQHYRKDFLKRKNINRYKKSNKGTPVVLDKLLNSFDRKIKGVPIFNDEVKKEYFEGLQNIFNNYYEDTFQPRITKRQYYSSYLAIMYDIYGVKNYKEKSLTLKEFISTGELAKFKKIIRDRR